MEFQLQKSIQTAKEEFMSNLLSSYNTQPALLFRYISDLSKPSLSPKSILHLSEIVSDPLSICEIFNNYFHSTFSHSNSHAALSISDNFPAPQSSLSQITLDPLSIYKLMLCLDSNKLSTGCDGIPNVIYKTCADSLYEPISHLFNLCLQTGYFPQEWKLHKICPIPKKGNLLLVENYRPISLLCSISKIFEAAVLEKIAPFIHPKISATQFGFMPNRSCLSALLSSYAYVFDSIDKNLPVDAVFLDFAKAFDTVPHNELLFKLWCLGITGPLWNWFRAYLFNKHHFVSLGGVNSKSLPVLSGFHRGASWDLCCFSFTSTTYPPQLSTPSAFSLQTMANYCIRLQVSITLTPSRKTYIR